MTEEDYRGRVSRVFLFIDQHLNESLSLELLAGIAHFSPFHFHRVFKYIAGETLNEHITRRRLEKAASGLVHQRETSIAELAARTGFNNSTSFTRAFKKFYGLSPSAFREKHDSKFSKIGHAKSKIGQDTANHEPYLCAIGYLNSWLNMNASVEIKELPQLQIAFISCLGPQNLQEAFHKLIRWAGPGGILKQDGPCLLTVYHDSFKVTAPEKVRMSAAVILKETVKTGPEICLSSIEKGKFITARFLISMNEFEKAWTSLFIWMSEHGYRKADRNPFEMYHNDFREHPEHKCDVALFIPVES